MNINRFTFPCCRAKSKHRHRTSPRQPRGAGIVFRRAYKKECTMRLSGLFCRASIPAKKPRNPLLMSLTESFFARPRIASECSLMLAAFLLDDAAIFCANRNTDQHTGDKNPEHGGDDWRPGCLDIGGGAPSVIVYYGASDGGANESNWDHAVNFGIQSGAFSHTVSNLVSGNVYYFTSLGVNSAGNGWAVPSFSFTTLTPALAAVTNLARVGHSGNRGDPKQPGSFNGQRHAGDHPLLWADRWGHQCRRVGAKCAAGFASGNVWAAGVGPVQRYELSFHRRSH